MFKSFESVVGLYVAFLKKIYHVFLLLVVFLSVWSAVPTIHLFRNIDTDLKALLPEDYPSVLAAKKVEKKVDQHVWAVSVVFEFNEPKVGAEYLSGIADYISQSPYVTDVDFEREGYDFFEKNGMMFLSLEKIEDLDNRIDREIQKRKLGGLYIDFDDDANDKETFDFSSFRDKYASETSSFPTRYYVNEKGTVYSVLLYASDPYPTFAYMQDMLDDVKTRVNVMEIVKNGVASVYYAGGFVTRINEYNILTQDLRIAGIVALLGISFFLIWRFRRFQALVFIFVPFGFALLWNFAIAAKVVGKLNVVTAFLFSILFGMGVDFGIHMLARYWEERHKGLDLLPAIARTISTTGRSCVTAGLTTAPAFYLLMINTFKGFSEFGFIAGTGLILSVASFLTIFPCLLILADRLGFSPPLTVAEPVISVFNVGWRHPRATIIVVVILFVTTAAAIVPRLHFEYDFKKLKARIEGADVAKDKMRESVRGGGAAAVVLVDEENDIFEIRRQVEKIAASEGSIADKFYSFDRFVPDKQEEKKKVLARIDKRFDGEALKLLKDDEKEKIDDFRSMLKPDEVTAENLPPSVRKSFFGKEDVPGQLVIISPRKGVELDDGRNAMKFADEVREIRVGDRVYHATSANLIFADVLDTMLRDSKRAIPLVLLAVVVVLWIDFRSWKRVAIVSFPLAVGVMMMFGIMCIFGLKLNFYNMIVLPTLLGLGVDYGVYFYHRYLEDGPGSVPEAMRHTGSAIFITATTTMLGFAGLILANHMGLSSLGTLAVIGIATCLFAAVISFPALLRLMENIKSK